MKIRVEIDEEAQEQFANLDRWWRSNREAAAAELADAVAHMVQLLATTPEMGKRRLQRGVKNVRWVPLQKTPYLLYYRHEPGSDLVTVISFWSAMKKRGPKIRKL